MAHADRGRSCRRSTVPSSTRNLQDIISVATTDFATSDCVGIPRDAGNSALPVSFAYERGLYVTGALRTWASILPTYVGSVDPTHYILDPTYYAQQYHLPLPHGVSRFRTLRARDHVTAGHLITQAARA